MQRDDTLAALASEAGRSRSSTRRPRAPPTSTTPSARSGRLLLQATTSPTHCRRRPGTTGSDIVDFLTNKQGYCVQYAAALAWLVREARLSRPGSRSVSPTASQIAAERLPDDEQEPARLDRGLLPGLRVGAVRRDAAGSASPARSTRTGIRTSRHRRRAEGQQPGNDVIPTVSGSGSGGLGTRPEPSSNGTGSGGGGGGGSDSGLADVDHHRRGRGPGFAAHPGDGPGAHPQPARRRRSAGQCRFGGAG